MARRRERPVDLSSRLRREMIERCRVRIRRHRHRVEFPDGAVVVAPWRRLLAQLEAGETVEVYGIELPAWSYEPPPAHRVSVDADGTVTVLS